MAVKTLKYFNLKQVSLRLKHYFQLSGCINWLLTLVRSAAPIVNIHSSCKHQSTCSFANIQLHVYVVISSFQRQCIARILPPWTQCITVIPQTHMPLHIFVIDKSISSSLKYRHNSIMCTNKLCHIGCIYLDGLGCHL